MTGIFHYTVSHVCPHEGTVSLTKPLQANDVYVARGLECKRCVILARKLIIRECAHEDKYMATLDFLFYFAMDLKNQKIKSVKDKQFFLNLKLLLLIITSKF